MTVNLLISAATFAVTSGEPQPSITWEAEMAVKRRETGLPGPTGGREALTLRQLLDRAQRGPWRDVKSFTTLHSNIKFLNERLGDHFLDAITAEVLENFAARMSEQGYKPGTIKRKLSVLSRALTLAERWGHIPKRPVFPEVKVRNTKDRVLTADEEVEVYRAIRIRHMREPWRRWDEFGDLVTVLLQTGARLGEVIKITPAGLGRGADGKRYVTFTDTKNDKPRTIPLTGDALAALERTIGEPCGSSQCLVVPIWHFNETKAWFFWSIIRKDVGGLDDVTLHTLRHTALTRLAQGGLPLLQLSAWAGHTDPRITAQRYTHLMPSDLDGGLAILERNAT